MRGVAEHGAALLGVASRGNARWRSALRRNPIQGFLFVMSPPVLFRHQQDLLEATWHLESWALLFEQGTGKTAPTIHTASRLFVNHKIDGAIVIAPGAVHRAWVLDEIPKHSPIPWRALDWHSDRGKAQDRALAKLLDPVKHGELAWLSCTYDGLMTDRGRAAVLAFKDRYPRFILTIDEGKRVANPTAKRTKKVAALRKFAAYARLLNGTPCAQSPLELYSQFKILDDSFWLQHGIGSWTAFQARFAVTRKMTIGGDDDREDRGPGKKREPIIPHDTDQASIDAYEQLDLSGIIDETPVKPSAVPSKRVSGTVGRTINVIVGFRELDTLKAMIDPMSTRITKEDAGLDLPPKLYNRLVFDLLPEQRRIYDTLRTQFMVEFDDGALITAAIAMVRVLRLQQICCGYLPDPENPENPKLFFDDDGKNPRLQLLLDRLEDCPHQAIIWARFTHDVDAICRALGPPKCTRYDGEVSGSERDKGLDRFREGKVKFVVAKAASMGVGLTLTMAKSAFIYSSTFSLYERLQLEDRCHRVGTTTAVSYYDIIANRTVDERILKSLQENKNTADKITGDEYRSWLEA